MAASSFEADGVPRATEIWEIFRATAELGGVGAASSCLDALLPDASGRYAPGRRSVVTAGRQLVLLAALPRPRPPPRQLLVPQILSSSIASPIRRALRISEDLESRTITLLGG